MAREDLHFRLRIPEDLKIAIEAEAEKNHRSMTAEIVARLTKSLELDFMATDDFAEVRSQYMELKELVKSLSEALKRSTERELEAAERLRVSTEAISQSNEMVTRLLNALEAKANA